MLLHCIGAARREGDLHVVTSLFRSFLDGCVAGENNQVCQRNLLPFASVGLRFVEALLDGLELFENLG